MSNAKRPAKRPKTKKASKETVKPKPAAKPKAKTETKAKATKATTTTGNAKIAEYAKKAPNISANITKALNHELRRAIVGLMKSKPYLSPNEAAKEFGISVSTAGYHFTVLKSDCEVITLVKEEKRRGAMEHFYKPTKELEKWLKK